MQLRQREAGSSGLQPSGRGVEKRSARVWRGGSSIQSWERKIGPWGIGGGEGAGVGGGSRRATKVAARAATGSVRVAVRRRVTFMMAI